LLKKQQNDPLTPPNKINPEISHQVNDAILQGMTLYPENRSQTIQEWLDLLPNNNCAITEVITTELEQVQNNIEQQSNYQDGSPRNQPTKLLEILKVLKTNKKIIPAGIITLLVVMSLGIRVKLTQNSWSEQKQEEVVEIPTAKLIKYENTNYGFRLQYFPDWTLREYEPDFLTRIVTELIPPNTSGSSTAKIFVEVKELGEASSIDDLLQNAIIEITSYSPNANISEQGETTLAKRPAYILIYRDGENKQKMQVGTIYNYREYVITSEAETAKYLDWKPKAEEIINSFELFNPEQGR